MGFLYIVLYMSSHVPQKKALDHWWEFEEQNYIILGATLLSCNIPYPLWFMFLSPELTEEENIYPETPCLVCWC